MKVIIDRFEGKFAVCECEDRTMINIETNRLPKGLKEGSVLIIEGDGISLDVDETKEREERIKKMMDNLWE